ncbi:MAG TPA: MgtC/SapB family protein [archaeon]|nr:MgtC/SapB family protein [archaeon]
MLENFLQPIEITFLVNVVLCIIIGFFIGAERESRGKDAGIHIHTMVIVGSMLFTLLSHIVDPESTSRIASGIVTGIGFLGAGIILRDGTNVRNLTTAASIWVSGAIGMAIGFGYYGIAVIAMVASVIIPRLPHLHNKSPEAMNVNSSQQKK